MLILVIEPGRKPEVQEIDGSLKSMQNIVGGYIQVIYPFDDPVALVCNEEGKLTDLPVNRALWDTSGRIYDVVFGTFFLCGAPSDSNTFTDITPEQEEKYRKVFKNTGVFLEYE